MSIFFFPLLFLPIVVATFDPTVEQALYSTCISVNSEFEQNGNDLTVHVSPATPDALSGTRSFLKDDGTLVALADLTQVEMAANTPKVAVYKYEPMHQLQGWEKEVGKTLDAKESTSSDSPITAMSTNGTALTYVFDISASDTSCLMLYIGGGLFHTHISITGEDIFNHPQFYKSMTDACSTYLEQLGSHPAPDYMHPFFPERCNFAGPVEESKSDFKVSEADGCQSGTGTCLEVEVNGVGDFTFDSFTSNGKIYHSLNQFNFSTRGNATVKVGLKDHQDIKWSHTIDAFEWGCAYLSDYYTVQNAHKCKDFIISDYFDTFDHGSGWDSAANGIGSTDWSGWGADQTLAAIHSYPDNWHRWISPYFGPTPSGTSTDRFVTERAMRRDFSKGGVITLFQTPRKATCLEYKNHSGFRLPRVAVDVPYELKFYGTESSELEVNLELVVDGEPTNCNEGHTDIFSSSCNVSGLASTVQRFSNVKILTLGADHPSAFALFDDNQLPSIFGDCSSMYPSINVRKDGDILCTEECKAAHPTELWMSEFGVRQQLGGKTFSQGIIENDILTMEFKDFPQHTTFKKRIELRSPSPTLVLIGSVQNGTHLIATVNLRNSGLVSGVFETKLECLTPEVNDIVISTKDVDESEEIHLVVSSASGCTVSASVLDPLYPPQTESATIPEQICRGIKPSHNPENCVNGEMRCSSLGDDECSIQDGYSECICLCSPGYGGVQCDVQI